MTAKQGKGLTKDAHAGKPSSGKGLISGLRLMNDRNAVFMFLILLVIILFVFDALSEQGARTSIFQNTIQQKTASGDVANQLMSQLIVDNSRRGNDVGFIVKGAVDPQLLQYFASMDYEQIKAQLGVQNDFVIHFEDENGRLIPIGNKWCIGSKNAAVNGIPCG